MPRPSKGARLFKRKPRYRGRKLVAQAVWIIKDGGKTVCVAVVDGRAVRKVIQTGLDDGAFTALLSFLAE